MNKIRIANSELNVSEISLGLFRIAELPERELKELIYTALEEEINFFDHADIYGNGKCEEKFGQAIKSIPNIREKIIIQTKCGIRNAFYDFSKDHIINAVEGSLRRLNTGYIDVLLLHRPDALIEPDEVAEAFERLYRSGKVRYFGVSNFNPMQIELLSQYINHKIIVNQMQFSIMHTGMIDFGLTVNTHLTQSVNRDGAILDYCRLKDITIQAWSPFQYGFLEGVFLDNDKFPELNNKINHISEIKGVSNNAIAIAWILRHPAKIQVIVGTTKAGRLKEICKASGVRLSRKEWYEIYIAAGNRYFLKTTPN